jgi:Tol biopolymer transport system component
LFGWDPDGWSILFTSKRSGSFDLWRIRVAEGKPQGEAELVKSDLGDVDPLGSTPKGSFFYGRGQVIRNVYVATLDMASGGIVTTPVLVSTAHVGSADSPAWSPDGNYLAYLAPAYKGFVVSGGAGKLCILSLKDGRQREFDLAYEYHIQDDAHLSWSPDGQSILASSFARGVCRIDTRTGEVSTAAAINGLIADWSPDANTVYTVRPWMSDSRPAVVLSHDAASGQEKELYHSVERISLPIAGRPLSPDGKWLAVGRFVQKEDTATRPIKILLIPTSGGEARELVTIEAPQGLLDFCWTPDGKHIVYSQYNRKGGFTSTVELWEIFMEGGTPRKLGLSMGWLHQVSFHPDGKRIAFTAGGQSWYDVWVIENLPPLKASR